MAVTLPEGTKERLTIDVTDALGNLVTLDAADPRYTVEDPSGTNIYEDEPATNVLLKAFCMIDTTTGGPWPAGDYKIWLRLDALPEIPLLGPYEFTIETGPGPT